MESIRTDYDRNKDLNLTVEDILEEINLVPYVNDELRKEKLLTISDELSRRAKIVGLGSAKSMEDFVKKLKPIENKLQKKVKEMLVSAEEFIKIHDANSAVYETGFILAKEFFDPDEKSIEVYSRALDVYEDMIKNAVKQSKILEFEERFRDSRLNIKLSSRFISDLKDDKETMELLWDSKYYEIKADAKALQVFDRFLGGDDVIIYPHCGVDLRPLVAFKQETIMASCFNVQNMPETLMRLKAREENSKNIKVGGTRNEKLLPPSPPAECTSEIIKGLPRDKRMKGIWCPIDTVMEFLRNNEKTNELPKTCLYWGFNGKHDELEMFIERYSPEKIIVSFEPSKRLLEELNEKGYKEMVADNEGFYRKLFSKTRNRTVDNIMQKSAVTNGFYVPRFFIK